MLIASSKSQNKATEQPLAIKGTKKQPLSFPPHTPSVYSGFSSFNSITYMKFKLTSKPYSAAGLKPRRRLVSAYVEPQCFVSELP